MTPALNPEAAMRLPTSFIALGLTLLAGAAPAADLVRSAKSGPWSDPATWEVGRVPAAGSRVQVRTGHTVVYDVNSDAVIRSVHVAGTLSFSRDKDTRLDVGLLKIQAGDDASENGFDCEAHLGRMDESKPSPALEVGTPDQPVPAGRTALIRLAFVAGLDPKSCPAIVCCGGRMDFHGAPMSRTWVKLGSTAKAGDSVVSLSELVTGWRVGDRVVVTLTRGVRLDFKTRRPEAGGVRVFTEERTIKALDGQKVTLDKPLEFEHSAEGELRGEVANLSRNVVVESADPGGVRGHTMYHRYSTGSIGYAEFRHLGKEGVLGRYSLHYHLCGDTMRGSSVIGASVWDSANRWLTVHGTQYLVVRDCVGYRSVGHGFYLEDGTEMYNVLDRNLAVQAFAGKPLPDQFLPFDQNEGAGFWWANSGNAFVHNVTCENDRYGYRFEATPGGRFRPFLSLLFPDGRRVVGDVRTVPFVRFDRNESHCDGLYGFNLGEGVNRIGPDEKHPFVIRNLKLWEDHYAFRPQTPCVRVEGLRIERCDYGVYTPDYDRHAYRDVFIGDTQEEPFNRGLDDDSIQNGVLTVDGLTFAGMEDGAIPLIQLSDNNATGTAEMHFRNVKVIDRKDDNKRALANRGGGSREDPKTPKGVPAIFHDWYGPGRHAQVVSVKARDLIGDGSKYREEPPLTGDESRVTEVRGVTFPEVLSPTDDWPPVTVITHVGPVADGKRTVRGVTVDNGAVKRVVVNGKEAVSNRDNFLEWEAVVEDKGDGKVEAFAEDAAGNVEKRPHVWTTH